MEIVIIKTDRVYTSRQNFKGQTAPLFTADYFAKSDNTEKTNLEIPSQISNSADFEIHQMKWSFDHETDVIGSQGFDVLAACVKTGKIQIIINDIQVWTGFVSCFVAPTVKAGVEVGATRRDVECEGFYIFNEPLLIPKGQAFQILASYENTAALEDYVTEMSLFGLKKTYNQAKQLPANVIAQQV